MEKSGCYLGMPDVFSRKKRSEVMSKIRSRNNRDTELALVRLLRVNKIKGWRRHQRVFGHPDFVFSRSRMAVFVDGCFWHSCPRCRLIPKQNSSFWRRKHAENKLRDQTVNRTLRHKGWRVIRIWECDMRKAGVVMRKKLKAILNRNRSN